MMTKDLKSMIDDVEQLKKEFANLAKSVASLQTKIEELSSSTTSK